MGRPALKDEEIRAFRAEICEAALRLFAESGFNAVTMRAIAEEVGCSPAKPYSYFDGKRGIFAATRARCFQQFSDHVEDWIDGIDDPEAALRAQATAYIEFARNEPHAFQIMFDLEQAAVDENPELRSSIRRSWNILRGCVADAIDAGVLQGNLDEIAHLMWSGVHGIAALEQAGTPGPKWDPAALIEPMMNSLIVAHQPDGDTPTDDSRD